MKKLRFKKIDAFTSPASQGNPAAVVYLDGQDDLTDREKLQIARELKGFVSEVGYVAPGKETDFALDYFSSEREVAFCGHATIAIMNDVVADNAALRTRRMLTIATRTERLAVENRYGEERSVYIAAPPPRFSGKEFAAAEIAAALNCPTADIDGAQPLQAVNGGLETLIVPMTGLAAVLAVRPDLRTLNAFCLRGGVDIVLVYSREVAVPECRYRTRVFAAPFGYLEDPATGSGNAAFGYYLLAHRRWTGEDIRIEQNGLRHNPNFIQLFARETDGDAARVWFGGGATVRIAGEYYLE